MPHELVTLAIHKAAKCEIIKTKNLNFLGYHFNYQGFANRLV